MLAAVVVGWAHSPGGEGVNSNVAHDSSPPHGGSHAHVPLELLQTPFREQSRSDAQPAAAAVPAQPPVAANPNENTDAHTAIYIATVRYCKRSEVVVLWVCVGRAWVWVWGACVSTDKNKF